MKRRIKGALLILAFVLQFVGCGQRKKVYLAYTFKVDTGDSIRVMVDTMDGYSLAYGSPFAVTCNEEVLSQGVFITAERYEQYCDVVSRGVSVRYIEMSEKDGNEYIFWCFNEEEYIYAVKVQDTATGILIGNSISEESARECFGRLVIRKAEGVE